MSDTIHKDIKCNNTITVTERSSDPSNPGTGESVTWVGDGTGSGADGDLLATNNNGSSSVAQLLGCRSPHVSTVRITDYSITGTPSNVDSILIPSAGTYLMGYSMAGVGAVTGGVLMWVTPTTASTSNAIAGSIQGGQGQQWMSHTWIYTASASETLYWVAASSSTGGLLLDVAWTGAGEAGGIDSSATFWAVRVGL